MRRAGRRPREERFEGFASLEGLPVPVEIFDLLPRLTNIELRAFLYLLPHVRREGSEAGLIPLDQLVERITAPPGGRDPGLSRLTFVRACGGLVRKGLLLADGDLFDPRVTDFSSSRLRLRFKAAAGTLRSARSAAVVTTPRVEAPIASRSIPLLLIQDLIQIGLTRRQARELTEACSVEEIERQMLVLPLRGAEAPVECMLRSVREGWAPPPQAATLLSLQPGRGSPEVRDRVEAQLGATNSPVQRMALMKEAAERIRVVGGPHFTDARVPHRLRVAFARWILAERLGVVAVPRSVR